MDSLIANRYKFHRELGRGGMAVVYLVEHTRAGDDQLQVVSAGHEARWIPLPQGACPSTPPTLKLKPPSNDRPAALHSPEAP